jgi:hypothetical protein
MKVEGDFWTSPCCLLDWQGAHSKVAHLVAVGRAPFRRARPYCLLDWQGAQAPLGGLVIFSFSLMQPRVDEKQIRRGDTCTFSCLLLTKAAGPCFSLTKLQIQRHLFECVTNPMLLGFSYY